MRWRILAGFLGALGTCAAQWEIGIAAGYGIYRNGTIISPGGKATAGFRNRFVVSATLEEKRDRLAGEFRYTFQDGDPFISAGGVRTNLQGVSHAFHYDVLVPVRSERAKLRPYAAVGIGAKLFVVTGPENPSQPLSEIGVLTTTDEIKLLVTGGGGVKFNVSPHVVLRLDFRDYITPFPKKLIAPAPFGTGRGILHQFTAMAGVSWRF